MKSWLPHPWLSLVLVVARLLILAGPRVLRPAFVTVELDLGDELAVSLLANIICLTPGTVSARLSANRRQQLVHTLDCPDPAATVNVKTPGG